MLPHEVVRQNNGSVIQPSARPHSRQVAPTTRATGRFIGYATSNNNRRQAFEEEKPMISKAQVLRDIVQQQQPPPSVKGLAALSHSYTATSAANGSPLSTMSPTRPHSTGGLEGGAPNGRTRSPPRLLGKAVINATNVLPDEIAAKAQVSTPTMPTARPPRGHTAGNTSHADLDISVERTSPIRPARVGSLNTTNTNRIPSSVQDEVVLPGSTLHRSSPDRSGFLPVVADAATNAPANGRPLTPATLTMPVSPSKGVRALQHVAQSRTNDSHTITAVSPIKQVANATTLGVIASLQGEGTIANRAEGREEHDQVDDPLSMARLLASYGITAQDVISEEGVDEGYSIQALAQAEGIQVNLKTMTLNDQVPNNTFATLLPPKMICNESIWIPCAAASGSQTRSIAMRSQSTSTQSNQIGNSPTKAATSSITQNHLIIDLSEWPMIDHGPAIQIPAAFLYKAGVEDHNIDRCLSYQVASSNETLFACGTPLVSNSHKGTLTLVPNPSACGSTTLRVCLEDCASVDPATGALMRSHEVVVYLHTMRTENTATNPASNADGTPHPPLISSLPTESAKKVIVPVPSTFSPVAINTHTAVGEDSATGRLLFFDDPATAGAAPTNLHAPYSFPLPNLFEVREDSSMRDLLQGLQDRAKAAAEAFDNANGNNENVVTNDLNPTGHLDCAFPFSQIVAPCYSSIATSFELLSALCGPTQWSCSLSQEEANNETLIDIRRSFNESALSTRLAELTTSTAPSANPSEDEEICALLERLAILRQMDGGAEVQGNVIEALEALSKRRAERLGFVTMADIGTKDPILQDRSVKPLAEEQLIVQHKSEQLIEALLKAAKAFCFYGRFVEALEAAETACKGAERYLGKDSHAHLSALVAVGTSCALRGDYVAATKSFETAVDISDMVNGSTSASTAAIVSLLAVSYCQHGDISTGISCLQRAQRVFNTLIGRAESQQQQQPAAASTGANTYSNLVTDLRLRATVVASMVGYWRMAGGELHKDLENNAVVQELISAIGAAEDNIFREEQLQAELGDEAISSNNDNNKPSAKDERLSSAGRSCALAITHHSVGLLMLSRRDAKAIHHFVEAARLVSQASELEEETEAEGNPIDGTLTSSSVAELCVFAAVAKGMTVVARMISNDIFNEVNIPEAEAALAEVDRLVGERHILHCRLVAVLGQLSRFNDDTSALNVHVGFLRTRETVRSVMCEPSLDAAIFASLCALTSLQQAKSVSSSSTTSGVAGTSERIDRPSSLRLAVGFATEAVDIIANCDALFGSSITSESILESIVEPMCLAVFSAVQEPLPPLVMARLERRIASIRSVHGETSLRLMEPLLNLGTAFYLEGNYQNAHHYLSKSLKVADTINLIFLLGHLFKPTVHLTASQVQERNRVAGDRLQIHQSAQFAIILYAIAGVYVAQGNADDAQSTYLQAQAALELAHMQSSIATSIILVGLAKFLYSEGHYGDAMAHAEKASGILREFHISVGHNSHNSFSVVPVAGKSVMKGVEEVLAVIQERTRSKGYILSKQIDGRHRFVVYL